MSIPPELWDDETWERLAARAVGLARDAGALAALPVALSYRAGCTCTKASSRTRALIEEADAITAATRNAPL